MRILAALCLAATAQAHEASTPSRGPRLPLELKIASVTYSLVHVDTLDATHGLAIGRTSAYGLQWRQPITRTVAEVWSLEYAGRRNAVDKGVCAPGAAECERPPRAFGYKEWGVRGTTVMTLAPSVLRHYLPWLRPFVGAGMGLLAVSEPRVRDSTPGRVPSTWFGESAVHLQTGAHLAIPHTSIVGAGEFRWSWMTWRHASERVRQTAISFAVIARL